MTEIDEMGGRAIDSEFIVDIKPWMRDVDVRATVNHKGHAQLVQNPDPRVIRLGRGDDDRVDASAGGQTATELDFVIGTIVGDRADQNIDFVETEPLGHAAHEFGKMKLAVAPHDHPNGASSAGDKAHRIDVGLVTQAKGLLDHPAAGGFGHFGIAAQSATDGCGGEA